MCLDNKCIPEKNLSNKETKIHKKPWITKGFIKSSKIKNKLYKKILKNGNEELKAKYKYYRNASVNSSSAYPGLTSAY